LDRNFHRPSAALLDEEQVRQLRITEHPGEGLDQFGVVGS
jgi:hypothetical protein